LPTILAPSSSIQARTPSDRGAAYYEKGEYDLSIADSTRAIEFDPTYANSYRHRGVAHLKTGKLYLARADLEKALSLEPDEQLKRSVASTRGVAMSRGLARIARPEGLIVAYATQSGNVAEDGSGRNSPFTAALLQNIETPGLEVGTLFRRVMGSVKQATNGKQHPELSVLFDGEFYFKPGS
jgi:tetratricopeptide (TPR) repeat protein